MNSKETRDVNQRMAQSLPMVSIIIPAYNEERLLPACLDSIDNLEYDKGLIEVIVIDNGSTDSTREIAQAYGVKLIRDDAKNVSGLRNLGVKEARGDIVAFVDADCVVKKDWLREASAYFYDASIAAWGSPPCIPDNSTWVQKTWFIVRRRDAIVQDVDWLESMNLFVHRGQFEAIGGFNESLETCEDVDFSYRMKARGRIVSDSRIGVIHYGEAATIRQFIKKEMWRGRGNLYGVLSHGLRLRELPSLGIPIYFSVILPLFLVAFTRAAGAGAVIAAIFFYSLPSILASVKMRNRIHGIEELLKLLFLLQFYFFCRTIAAFKKS
ncbi:MAG: glycosyltransferase family 2 protein [Syntrophobacteraceae bacterium]